MPIDKAVFERITSHDSTLIKLDLSYQNLSANDLQQLVEVLGINPYLRSLDVSGNDIDIECAKLLSKIPLLDSLVAVHCHVDDASLIALTQNKNFISLVLSDNNICGDAFKAFTEYRTLTHLDLSMNQINDDGVIVLAQQPTLTSLIISYNKIMAKGATALAQNTRLKMLDLGYNPIQAEGVAAFANNISLTFLGLANTSGGILGFVTLAKNPVLTSLDASYNQLGNEAAIALANCPQLTHLALSYNQIGFEGAYALSSNQRLVVLLLGYNQIGDGGAIALSRHSVLKKLDLTANRIGFEGAHALAKNTTITNLILSYNQVSDAGAITLARNTTLSELLLSYNTIGDIGALALAENSTLKILNLNYNSIGPKGKKALAENKAISSIILSEEQPPEFTAENLDTIFLLSESFICICSFEFIIQFFNPTFTRLLGYNADELLTKNYLDFFHPDDRAKAQKYFQDEKISPVLSSETRFRCKNGSYRLIRWTSQIMHHRRYTMGIDITEKKEFERNFIKAQEENIWLRLQEAQAFSKQQTEFIAHLSHEVRNPLTGIYGEVEMLKEHISAMQIILDDIGQLELSVIKKALIKKIEGMKESIDQVFNCAEYQKKILEENLDSAKIMEKKLILKNVSFDLSLAFKNVIQMLQSKAKAKKGLAIYYKGPETCLVKGDLIRVEQIVINLITNAIKFTDEGRIDIVLTVKETTPNFTQVEFTVCDTGIGIDSKEIGELFKRFSREAKSEYEGSGLGLYIIKQLINVMGGSISVKSEKGKGSIFTVLIPFQNLTEEEKEQFQQAAKKISKPITADSRALSLAKLSILIVDDDQLNRKIIGRYFAECPDYKCQYASNGEEALVAYDKQKFDVILMDIIMPIMDGIMAVQAIRKREQTKKLPRTPVIAISANVLERDKVEALEAGFDDFILKPFKKEEFFQKIAILVHNENVESKTSVKMASDSPVLNQQLREILNTITPGKKWGVNITKSIVWLELQSEKEALTVINHFKAYDYPAIEHSYKKNTTVSIPVLVLKDIQLEKLKKIPPLAEPMEEPLKSSDITGKEFHL